MFVFPVLIADIGGTNARFGIVQSLTGGYEYVGGVETSNHKTISDAIRSVFVKSNAPMPKSAILAVAAPVNGSGQDVENITLTNAEWVINPETISKDFNFCRTSIVNDYVPVAAHCFNLSKDDFVMIGHHNSLNQGARIVIGPGTGFGGAALIPYDNTFSIVSTEVGHSDLGPKDEEDFLLWKHLNKNNFIGSIESLLSGPGLVTLYHGVSKMLGKPIKHDLLPDQVTSMALETNDRVARKTVDYFFKLLGRVCGDLALTCLATGGVFICGGIAPRLLGIINHSEFRNAFEDHRPFNDRLKAITTGVIVSQQPGLAGLLNLISRPDMYSYHASEYINLDSMLSNSASS